MYAMWESSAPRAECGIRSRFDVRRGGCDRRLCDLLDDCNRYRLEPKCDLVAGGADDWQRNDGGVARKRRTSLSSCGGAADLCGGLVGYSAGLVVLRCDATGNSRIRGPERFPIHHSAGRGPVNDDSVAHPPGEDEFDSNSFVPRHSATADEACGSDRSAGALRTGFSLRRAGTQSFARAADAVNFDDRNTYRVEDIQGQPYAQALRAVRARRVWRLAHRRAGITAPEKRPLTLLEFPARLALDLALR